MSRFVALPIIKKGIQKKPIFHLDFKSATIADVSGKGYSVTNNGVTIVEQDGLKAGNFSAGCLTLDRTMFAPLWNAGTFTIDFYLRMNVITSSYILFGSCRSTDMNAPGTMLTSTNNLCFAYDKNWLGTVEVLKFNVNTWHHIKLVVKNKSYSFYLDGVFKKSGITADSFASWPLLLGGQTHSNSTTIVQNGFPGSIADFKIYDVALQQPEIYM